MPEGPPFERAAAHDHRQSSNAAGTPTSPQFVHNAAPQVDGSADARSRIGPCNTTADHRQSVNQFHRQQQRQQQCRSRSRLCQEQLSSVPRVYSTTVSHITSQYAVASSAATSLLPYCTVEVTLNQSQVIALSDIAGSLKELVLLALAAKDRDEECLSKLRGALGDEQALTGVVDFFFDEFEIG